MRRVTSDTSGRRMARARGDDVVLAVTRYTLAMLGVDNLLSLTASLKLTFEVRALSTGRAWCTIIISKYNNYYYCYVLCSM